MASTQDSENVRSLILAVLSGISAAASHIFFFHFVIFWDSEFAKSMRSFFDYIYIYIRGFCYVQTCRRGRGGCGIEWRVMLARMHAHTHECMFTFRQMDKQIRLSGRCRFRPLPLCPLQVHGNRGARILAPISLCLNLVSTSRPNRSPQVWTRQLESVSFTIRLGTTSQTATFQNTFLLIESSGRYRIHEGLICEKCREAGKLDGRGRKRNHIDKWSGLKILALISRTLRRTSVLHRKQNVFLSHPLQVWLPPHRQQLKLFVSCQPLQARMLIRKAFQNTNLF